MYIPIILGTARNGRYSDKVAAFTLEKIIAAKIESEIIDVKNYRIIATDNTGELPEAKKLSEKIKKASGLIIVTPEYNHGYPGELKMMLDMCYEEYAGKPVGFCGVSAGGLGGARVVEQLRQVAVELHMIPIREALYFPVVRNMFDDNGKIKDPSSYNDRFDAFLNELVSYLK